MYDQRAKAAPVSLSQLKPEAGLDYRTVALRGRFDNQHVFLLDNRIYQGRPGYEVISAFELEPAVTMAGTQKIERLWVNRGWIPMNADRSIVPVVEPVQGVQTIAGQLVSPADSFVLAKGALTGNWPETIQRVELEKMNNRLGVGPSLPYLLRLNAGEAGSFKVSWQPVSTRPQKSLGYAVQWFLMAAVLTGLFFWVVFKTTDERGHE